MIEHKYCKRLIEVDLPIKKISEHARREKGIHHGNISTLHIWWARRPLAACRAVILASLLPDPVDPQCPESFRKKAKESLQSIRQGEIENNEKLRELLLDFIADFSSWELAINQTYLEISRKLIEAAYPNGRPLVFDPFSGGGSIPLEAIRVGADALASDLNPVACLILKQTLEFIPKYGTLLVEQYEKWTKAIFDTASARVREFYSAYNENEFPIAYLWAKTISCEGPSCGAEIPVIRQRYIAKREKEDLILDLVTNAHSKSVEFEVKKISKKDNVLGGTSKRGSVICPVCGYTTSRKNIELQVNKKGWGLRLLCVVYRDENDSKHYRLPNKSDLERIQNTSKFYSTLSKNKIDGMSIFPDEELPYLRSIFNVNIYGIKQWKQLFTPRQLVVLSIVAEEIRNLMPRVDKEISNPDLAKAIKLLLAMNLNRVVDYSTNICVWDVTQERAAHTFGRQALGMVWDFAEIDIFAHTVGSWESMSNSIINVIRKNSIRFPGEASVVSCSATSQSLPDDSADYLFTDPPYYDAVPYANLSDFFYVWFKRTLRNVFPEILELHLTPKDTEIVQLAERNEIYKHKTKEFFELGMMEALKESRRVLKPEGIGTVVFAHKDTASWEALLGAIIKAGWVITASWPIDTEQPHRLRAQNAAALASSIHLICRPRENPGGSVISSYIGDWRDVLQELPKRIHEWMPRLAKEGVVGADAIFSCLGPALEVFSKYSHVEKANGEKVELKEYLEQVWAAVAKEALNMIFEGARTEGFEEDARLTAMWLWTLFAGASENGKKSADENGKVADESEAGGGKASVSGFSLEFDAARKIAQGLGAHLENLNTLVEIEGDQARLLSVAERVKILFGKDSSTTATYKRKKKDNQMTLFPELEEMKENEWSLGDNKASLGKTILDRLHQAMILFGAGRAEALRRFLVEEGVGKDDRFWRLAQALSALYPTTTDEKRWVDGVLAKKKSFGF